GAGAAASEVIGLADNGFPWQASIGADVQRQEFVDAGAQVKVNGRTFSGPLTVVRASTLREISFVPLGADASTSATVGAERKKNMPENADVLDPLAAERSRIHEIDRICASVPLEGEWASHGQALRGKAIDAELNPDQLRAGLLELK